MHQQLSECSTLDEHHAASLMATLDEILELASDARALAVVGRKSGIVLALAKAPLSQDDRQEGVG